MARLLSGSVSIRLNAASAAVQGHSQGSWQEMGDYDTFCGSLLTVHCSHIRLLLLLSEIKNSIKMHTCYKPQTRQPEPKIRPHPVPVPVKKKIESGTNEAVWQQTKKITHKIYVVEVPEFEIPASPWGVATKSVAYLMGYLVHGFPTINIDSNRFKSEMFYVD